ncbi:glycosyl transferase [Fundidesulfovibrio terrae]|uniref:glycosyl transferase n=1 Tax=Fundidesulfovibrio terrae TaxID=2922866 RepID=UPI001FAE8EB7
MAAPGDVLISVVTPSRGDRPNALALAARSLDEAAANAVSAGLMRPGQVEWLVGFDGVKGVRPETTVPATFVDFPKSGNFGNYIRDRLIGLARGARLMFLDDDNALTPNALASFLSHPEVEMVIARIDVGRAFDIPYLPRPGTAEEAVRQGNIDPLCLCLSRDLVAGRGRGWGGEGGYESDFLNIRRYFQRARSVARIDDVVGVYDAGRGLDPEGVNPRQAKSGDRTSD